jgi:leucyl aminopeptidase (aminopeptidase T)
MLIRNIKHILFHCGGLKNIDHLLIIFDRDSKILSKLFLKYSKDIAKKAISYEVKKQKNHGEKVSKELENLMLNSTLILCMSEFSMAHSDARIKASKQGARFLSLPGYNKKFVLDQSIYVDYKKHFSETKKITNLLTKSSKIIITSAKGTNLKLKTLKRTGNCCPGFVSKPGDLGSPPDIESNISPLENFSSGKIVIDGSIATPKIKLLKSNVLLNVDRGKIIKYFSKNKKVMEHLDEIFLKTNKKRRILAEFGIGLNYKSKLTGNMLTDEGCRGTIHFGFGSNSTVGGKNKINFHLDFIMKNPTVVVNNKKIISNGKIQKI